MLFLNSHIIIMWLLMAHVWIKLKSHILIFGYLLNLQAHFKSINVLHICNFGRILIFINTTGVPSYWIGI